MTDKSVWASPKQTSLFERIRSYLEKGTVTDLLADTSDYNDGIFVENTSFQVEGFRYKVAAIDALDHNLETKGGIKLYTLTSNTPVTPAQFGADVTGAHDSGIAIQRMFDYIAVNGGYAKINGTLRIEFPEIPADPTGIAALYLPVLKSPQKPTVLDFSGATINYHGISDTYLFRFYQSGNNAGWPNLRVIGGYFDGSNTSDPAGCILWDDLGGCSTHGCVFNQWSRLSENENAYAIHQRNYDSWSENCTHEDHRFLRCDTWFYASVHPSRGATNSMARTRLENFFGNWTKAYSIINTAGGMYDSIIRNIKGNGQKIATILNTGNAVFNTHLQMVKTEQGQKEKTDFSGFIMSGSQALTVSKNSFFENWYSQGMPITIVGAGSEGSNLVTYIIGYENGNQVTVADAASSTVFDAKVVVSSTVCYEDRSSLHQFTFSHLNNRDGDKTVNFNRFTGKISSPRATQFGGINCESEVFAEKFCLSSGNFVIKSSSVQLDELDSSMWVAVPGISGNRCLYDLYVTSGNSYKGKFFLTQSGDTGSENAVLNISDKASGYGELDIRTSGTEIQVRSIFDNTVWRGTTVTIIAVGIE